MIFLLESRPTKKIIFMSIATLVVMLVAFNIQVFPSGRAYLIPKYIVDTNAFKSGWLNVANTSIELKYTSKNPLNDKRSLLVNSTEVNDVDVMVKVQRSPIFKFNFTYASDPEKISNMTASIVFYDGNDTAMIKNIGQENGLVHEFILVNNVLNYSVSSENVEFKKTIDSIAIIVNDVKGMLFFIDIELYYSF